MDIETLLNKELKSEFEVLEELEGGTDDYVKMVDGIAKLMDRAIEIEKINLEHDERIEQAKEEKKDRLIKNIMTAAGIIIPTIVTIWGTKASFKFEQEGTITTIMGRGFINKLLPKK